MHEMDHHADWEAKPIKPLDEVTKKEWLKSKAELLERDEIIHHAWENHKLSKKEAAAEKKLNKARVAMIEKDPVIVTESHYDKLDSI